MGINYTKAAALAQKLITDNGKTVNLIRTSETPQDVDKPWNGPDPAEDPSQEIILTVPALQLMPNQVRVFNLSALGDATILNGLLSLAELVYIVFQGENDLEQFTFLEDNGVRYHIEGTQTLRPANTTLLGYVGVRR